MRIGFVHTVPALATSFDAALHEAQPDAVAVHVVDADLLGTAIRSGVDAAVDERVAQHVRHLADDGVDAILVTCSSIGESTAKAARDAAVPVVRVDSAMADEAVAAAGEGGRILVLATLEATLGPTGRLLEGAAARSSASVTMHVVPDAAAARAAGDQERHDRLIADAVRSGASDAHVIVLAQASMAPAAALAEVQIPVLSSPASALAAVLEAAVSRAAAPDGAA